MAATGRSVLVGVLVSFLMLTAPLGGVAAVDPQDSPTEASTEQTNNGDAVVVDSERVDETTAEMTVVEDTAPDFEQVSEEAAIAGRGASFQAVVQELLTEAYMTGSADTSGGKSVSGLPSQDNVCVAYGVTGSSGGVRGFLGDSAAAADPSSGDPQDLSDDAGIKGCEKPTAEGTPGDRAPGTTDHPSVQSSFETFCEDSPANDYAEDLVVCSDRTIWSSSDAPLQPSEIEEAEKQGGVPIHIPGMIGTVTVSYNIPGIQSEELKLDGDLVSDLYLDGSGVVTWDDERIKELNPDIADQLPSEEIIPVHRCDGSGTTFAFTDYVERASSDGWQANKDFSSGNVPGVPGESGAAADGDDENPGSEDDAVPQGELLKSTTLCGNDNQGVADVVEQTSYSFGYVEFGEALERPLDFARLQNADQSTFVAPGLDTASAAAAGAADRIPEPWGDWSDVSIAYASDPDPSVVDAPAYPIGTFSYWLVYANPAQVELAEDGYAEDSDEQNNNEFTKFWTPQQWSAVRDYLGWALTDEVQNTIHPEAGLVPVPDNLRAESKFALETLTAYGPQETLTTEVQTDGFAAVGHEVSLSADGFSIENLDERAEVFPPADASGLDVTLNDNAEEYVVVQGATVVSTQAATGDTDTFYTAVDSAGNPFVGVVPQESACEPATGETLTLTGQVVDSHLVTRKC
jgi:ABC-type phosphate transport system substrate-binding protein